ncbi:hypothetical protein RM543_08030 [Roseicyclus sp. F158]|uniref:Glycosyltransferase family 2 protein n=1 Tax=Tropicimonas omnivorans TaxID=3075590 RepID=A0ABU3DFZ1_9RHOB|nr:hypothetical protein [Roseicyclus sp. F158]MDT0682630.1 hypothetical protein [Roseicyclus sp. F158]
MAQARATPKRRRAALLLAARLPGAERMAGDLSPSEAAALRLRRAGPPPGPAPRHVTYLIPLVGKHHVGNWDAVSARLHTTLESLARGGGTWQALICGQDRPTGDLPKAATFLPFAKGVEGNDKWDKLRSLVASLPEYAPASGLAMPFDADDILARGTGERLSSGKSETGWLVERGHVRDEGTGALALARPQSLSRPGQKAFWKLCGSCAAFRYDTAQPESLDFLSAAVSHEHRMFPFLAALAGRPLAPLPAPAVLYRLNHGENFGARRGRVSFKARFVRRFAVTNEDLQAAEALYR